MEKLDGRSKAAREARLADTDIVQTPEVKRGTKPGWKPSSVLPNLKARHGFTAKWVHNEPANIYRKQSEGWIVMKSSDNTGTPIRQFETPDANPLGSEIRYRDMIAMMISDDDKKAREEYYREQNQSAQRQILHKSDMEFKRSGVQTYTPKGMSGRIVIE